MELWLTAVFGYKGPLLVGPVITVTIGLFVFYLLTFTC